MSESTRRTRAVLAAVVFAVLLAQVLLYPGVDVLVVALGAPDPLGAATWFLAAEFGAFVAFAGVWGALSDATGRRVPYVVVGALGGALGYAVLGWLVTTGSAGFGVVLAVRVLQGALTIAAFSLSITMLMDLEGGHGRNMGAAGIAVGLGTALGAPLGGQLYEVGTAVPLFVAGGLLLVVAATATLLSDRTPAARGGALAVVAGLGRRPALVVPYGFGFVDRLTAGLFALVGTLYFRDVFGLSPGATGLVLALFFGPFALFQYPFGVLSDRVGRTVPVVVGSTLYGVAVAAVGLAPTVETAGLAMVGVGVVGALMAPATMALVTDLASETERGAAMAGFNAAGSVGFLVGIVAGGAVAGEVGYAAAFVAAGCLEVGLALATLPAFVRIEAAGESGSATRAER